MTEIASLLQQKAEDFAVRSVNLCKFLVEDKKEFIMSKQILRSGTSIGANISEAQSAISKPDFKAKIYVAQKEARETLYWLRILYRTDYLSKEQYCSIHQDCEELLKILVSITKNTK